MSGLTNRLKFVGAFVYEAFKSPLTDSVFYFDDNGNLLNCVKRYNGKGEIVYEGKFFGQ